MTSEKFPKLDSDSVVATRDALHGYAKVIGTWTKSSRKKRKHWWHASLRPSLKGLTSGVIYGAVDVELQLDFVDSCLHLRGTGTTESLSLEGQASKDVAAWLKKFLLKMGIDENHAPDDKAGSDETYPAYSAIKARKLQCAFASVAAAMQDFRAGIREESSPIQVWPHHFDLSMIWLPGDRIEGEDRDDEESADKQMNFGFVFGDDGISEPYFYVTAYPLPDALPRLELPGPASWRSDGFSGAVALYKDVAAMSDPHDYLLQLWNTLLDAGRKSI